MYTCHCVPWHHSNMKSLLEVEVSHNYLSDQLKAGIVSNLWITGREETRSLWSPCWLRQKTSSLTKARDRQKKTIQFISQLKRKEIHYPPSTAIFFSSTCAPAYKQKVWLHDKIFWLWWQNKVMTQLICVITFIWKWNLFNLKADSYYKFYHKKECS